MRRQLAVLFPLLFAALARAEAPAPHQVLAAEALVEAGDTCQSIPAFVRAMKIRAPVFSTRARFPAGLLLYDGSEASHAIQLPTWQRAGRLGPFVIDKRGNLLVLPVPHTNTLDNPPEQQNSIFRVDAETGELALFMSLPMPQPPSQANPYGLLAIAYDCAWDMLYVASVSGSRRLAEKGRVLAISLATKEVISTLQDYDALSLLLIKQGSSKRLLVGSARRSQIEQIEIDTRGAFVNTRPRPCLSIDAFDELRARKLQWDKASNMLRVTATEFFYNLVAQTEFREEVSMLKLCQGQ